MLEFWPEQQMYITVVVVLCNAQAATHEANQVDCHFFTETFLLGAGQQLDP